ncbi:hypothetical protein LSH36_662g02028 [Paralvinella palmiformis]|uniref:Solute carrier family 35 member B1 n=1 Tax=Paralvinella palmiformis TaxID=53620 RepID=A0AAD9J402_9ANNE|nr:hypothetical protein LSH36_662g02028 [Paralvinella palmiformis]
MLVFVQCVINVVFARCALQIHCPEKDNSPQKYYALMAFSYLGAMVASNLALQYVSYPTQVLGKSAKPIPVMILGVIMARKKYPFRKYIFVFMIVIGVALFMYKDKKAVDTTHTLGSGEVLLLVSLFLDGITGGVQDKLRAEHRSPTHCMMLWMNVWSVIYLGVAIIVTGEGIAFMQFASRFPMVIVNMLIFSVCSAVGQNFIFMTVTNFGPLTCSIFTTTRKFFTILASVIIFQNPMAFRQWIGTVCVFIGLALDSMYGKERKPPKNTS